MSKKILTLVLPAVTMLTAACGGGNEPDPTPEHKHTFSSEWTMDATSHWHAATCGHDVVDAKGNHVDSDNDKKCDVCKYDMSTPTPENKELAKFNELVSDIKTNHNYTLSIHSLVEGLEDQELNCHRYNLNNKAWFHDNSIFDTEGIIYQKDQGYVTFAQAGEHVVPMSLSDDFYYATDPRIFVSTNPSLGITDITEVIGENLFVGDYVQDTTDKTKFTTTNKDNTAVAAYLTQYYPYIASGQLQIETTMYAEVDVTNSTITLELHYYLWYFDITDIKAPGVITIKLENVGSTSNSTLESYMENPTHKFEPLTSWPSSMDSVFAKCNNSVTPTMPSGLSYAAVYEEILYDGFYYAGVQDMNCGDLRETYGETLLSEGYTKVSDNSYKKVDIQGINSVTYKVIMKYDSPTSLYPNGEMKVLFRADKTSGTFSSIADFNQFLSLNKYDELVPALPAEATCTSVENVKDQTDNETYCLRMNGTDYFKVKIASYTKAQAFVNTYANLLVAKGYSDTSKMLSATNYSLNWSTTGSYVSIDMPSTEAEYTGYVGIKYVVTKADEESLRPTPAPALDRIEISGMSTAYKVGESFSFDGVCTAYYSDSTSKVVTPTYVSSPDMTTTGEKTIIVKYSERDVEKQTMYKINVSESGVKLVSLDISGFYDTQFLKNGTFNHAGMCVTVHYDDSSTKIVSGDASFDYNLSVAGIQPVTVSYTEDGVTVSNTYNILVSEGSLKWPGLSMAENDDVHLEGFFDSNYDTITNFNYNNLQSFMVEINTVAEIEEMYIDEDRDASIVLDADWGGGYKDYVITPTKTLDVSSYTLVIQTKELTKYNLSVSSSIEHGSLNFNEITQAAAGTEVDVYYEADEGYEIESISAVGHPELEISWYDYGGFYYFYMPEYDVELTATFGEKQVAHSVTGIGDIYVDGIKAGRVAQWYKYASVLPGNLAAVTITVQPGYELVKAYVEGHEEITLTDVSSQVGSANKWGFIMPNYDVVVTAEFRLIPKELSSISLSGQKADFTVGDTFSTGDLVVTANYANGEHATVTDYSVDSSQVNMNAAGNYTVTVSYTENEVTKTQTYGVIVKGGDVQSTVYAGDNGLGTYSYELTVNSDGTGVYVLTKTKNGTTSVYNQYFTWTDAGSGKINIVKDENMTSTLCTSDNYNLWFYWSGDSNSNKNTITISDTTASFGGWYSNGSGTQKTLTLTVVK